MTPRKASRRPLAVGMTGIRVPGHVGRWSVTEALVRVFRGEEVTLARCSSETMPKARDLLVNADTREVIFVIIGESFSDRLTEKGYGE